MESKDAVSLLELGDTLTNLVDGSGDVVALVSLALLGHVGVLPVQMLGMPLEAFSISIVPVLGVATRVDNLDDNLTLLSLGYRRVDNLDLGAGADDCFLHVEFGV